MKLLEIILKDSSKIPAFINSKITEHVVIWRKMQSIFETIVQLISPYILTPYQIQLLALDIDNDILYIQEIADSGLYSLVIVYLNKKLMHYSNYAIKNELYEVAENIKNYFSNI